MLAAAAGLGAAALSFYCNRSRCCLRAMATAAGRGEGFLLLLDWDDTVLPTTWIAERTSGARQLLNADSPCRPALREQCAALDAKAAELCRRTVERGGIVVILTAATRKWVEQTAAICLPRVHACLTQDACLVVSAQEIWRARGDVTEENPGAWKVHAARLMADHLADCAPRQYSIVGAGDRPHDETAARALVSGLHRRELCGSFRWRSMDTPRPSPEDLAAFLGDMV
jgi:hypothetical protein